MKDEGKRVVSHTLAPELEARLKARAEAENRSVSNLIEQACTQYVNPSPAPAGCPFSQVDPHYCAGYVRGIPYVLKALTREIWVNDFVTGPSHRWPSAERAKVMERHAYLSGLAPKVEAILAEEARREEAARPKAPEPDPLFLKLDIARHHLQDWVNLDTIKRIQMGEKKYQKRIDELEKEVEEAEAALLAQKKEG